MAAERGHYATPGGLATMLDEVEGIELVFDATSARAHAAHAELLGERGIRSVDLTPAALGPAVIPPVNIREHLDAPDVNLVTCGAQATVPIVAAISEQAEVSYAEIVSTISARSAGPGTRQNIDEFTQSTAASLVTVGGAERGKAIILLNPAEPPIVMRNTVFADVGDAELEPIAAAIAERVAEVATYVPGYRLTARPLLKDGTVTVLLEVTGAGDYLPEYAGNLDIMTSAAVRVAELVADSRAIR
jgi:acetaldehyde dehydrogenase